MGQTSAARSSCRGQVECESRNSQLARGFLLQRDGVCAARRTAGSSAQFFDVQLEFGDGPAESVAVHAELTRGFALVPVTVLQHAKNEFLLEFTDGFGISDAALVHLHDQSFQLVFHSASLCFLQRPAETRLKVFRRCRRAPKRAQGPFATSPSLRETAAAGPPALPKSRRGRRPAETAQPAIAGAIPIAERRPPAPAR